MNYTDIIVENDNHLSKGDEVEYKGTSYVVKRVSDDSIVLTNDEDDGDLRLSLSQLNIVDSTKSNTKDDYNEDEKSDNENYDKISAYLKGKGKTIPTVDDIKNAMIANKIDSGKVDITDYANKLKLKLNKPKQNTTTRHKESYDSISADDLIEQYLSKGSVDL